jgi:hypothetical protein
LHPETGADEPNRTANLVNLSESNLKFSKKHKKSEKSDFSNPFFEIFHTSVNTCCMAIVW